MSPQEQSRCQTVMDEALQCHPGGEKGGRARSCMELGREIPDPSAALSHPPDPRGAPVPGVVQVHPSSASPWVMCWRLCYVCPSPPPRASPWSWKGHKSPAAACLVTAAEFMNLSEWKKAGSLYHIQGKLSFKREFSVITLKGAILSQSVTTLTRCWDLTGKLQAVYSTKGASFLLRGRMKCRGLKRKVLASGF